MNITYLKPFLHSQPSQDYVESTWHERYLIEDPKVVMRLVNNLKYLFNIQPGDYLTFVLGFGECKTNDEALKYWVMDQLSQEPVGYDDVLRFLIDSLNSQLMMEAF
ncbi:MAG: hypothetical protein HUJ13_07960 [Hydrogenovibrio crunogenus]|uniref:Uncharacterized protein n=1 Tax=Hydrogenovibrio crunogenus (strain DSM 25203 / XCL-2) TaxID=317025 RepID=Q31DR4_HYDCU|nr:hypothetical protein [Hydrogenovibrio crunogenus]RUM92450.1 MAG: hypothetical protein DSZ27_02785 [Thiomicrospira sp.]